MTVRALKKKFSKEEIAKFSEEILALKKEKNAVILAHYYQELEVQDVADIVGDSLGLSQAARDVEDANFIVFAGVHFMAETAKILNPKKTVYIPNANAGCPMASQCSPDIIQAAREKHGKEVPVVVYVNTT
ncbi:MAG: quinolinate synthase NadA, partial [Candidatus Heimdallarchaeota archaeon]|nr:quinolinate synthase NadA [Candidatus Heimdallarchaeota archaeon]MCK4291295.1 quinolinate synthase NadA [Candidatus Heimdallarchaeota archaeon]